MLPNFSPNTHSLKPPAAIEEMLLAHRMVYGCSKCGHRPGCPKEISQFVTWVDQDSYGKIISIAHYCDECSMKADPRFSLN